MCLCAKSRFLVIASQTVGRKIRKGDQVLVDEDAKPAKGCYVVTGPGRFERWAGQTVIYGVAVRVARPL
jgi:hypothetical protein